MMPADGGHGDDGDDDEGAFTVKSGTTPSPKFRRDAMSILKAQEHASLRMEDGLKRMLQLHTPNELSSICGQLGLKILQKASVSIEQIMKFMTSQNKEKVITVDVAEKVLLAVNSLESERARLAAQLSESLESERSLTQEVGELRARRPALPQPNQPYAAHNRAADREWPPAAQLGDAGAAGGGGDAQGQGGGARAGDKAGGAAAALPRPGGAPEG